MYFIYVFFSNFKLFVDLMSGSAGALSLATVYIVVNTVAGIFLLVSSRKSCSQLTSVVAEYSPLIAFTVSCLFNSMLHSISGNYQSDMDKEFHNLYR